MRTDISGDRSYRTGMATPPPASRLYIKEWLDHLGVSFPELARRTGVKRETAWRWHHEQHRLRPGKVAKIAEVLGLTSTDLHRPPASLPSLDAIVKDAPPEVRALAVDIVTRLVRER